MKRDIELAYTDEGEGTPPLVLVHGLLCAREDWRPQAERFAPRHRVVRPDLRGHGASPRGTEPMTIETLAADVAALLEKLGLNGALLAGHSLGCRVVLEARRLAPERVAGLVLVDGSNLGLDGKEGPRRGLEQAIAAKGYRAFARGIFEDMFLEGHDPGFSAPIVERALAVPEEVCLSLFSNLIAYDADHAVAAMRAADIPMLVLGSTVLGGDRRRRALAEGEASPFMELALANCPRATVQAVPGVGHFTQLEAPETVNAAIAALLEKLSG